MRSSLHRTGNLVVFGLAVGLGTLVSQSGCAVEDSEHDEDEFGTEVDMEFRVLTAGEKCCTNQAGTVNDDNYCWNPPPGTNTCGGNIEVYCYNCNDENVGWLYHPGVWNGGNYQLPYYTCEGYSENRSIIGLNGLHPMIENDCDVCEDAPLPYKCNGQDEDSQAQNWHLEVTPTIMCATVDANGVKTPPGTNGFYPRDSSGGCGFLVGNTALFTCEGVQGTNQGQVQACQGWELGSNDLINSGASHEPAARAAMSCDGAGDNITIDGCYPMPYQCYGAWYTYPGHVANGSVDLGLCAD